MKTEVTIDRTKLTRKFAHSTNINHINHIIVDEHTAIYFRFPNPLLDGRGDTTYMVVTPDDQ